MTGTIYFSADGVIVWAKHDNPGSWNDGDMSLAFRESLVDPHQCPDPHYGVVADSAFPCSGDMTGIILTPLNEGDLGELVPAVRPVAKKLSWAITFVLQAAEWGMGSVEKVYYRLFPPSLEPRPRGPCSWTTCSGCPTTECERPSLAKYELRINTASKITFECSIYYLPSCIMTVVT